jgi:hypothetical protein
MRRQLVPILLSTLMAGCHPHGGSAPTGPVTARKIVDAADLIGGPRAEGRIGDWLLANDRIRVIIGDAQNSVTFDPFGGALLDADVVRPAGEPGQDRFGEAFPSINILTLADTATVEVGADGSDQHKASIRVKGHGYQFPILPPIAGLTNVVDVDLETDYSLVPGESSVLVETKITMNETASTLVQCYDVLLMGAGLDMFGAPKGASDTGTFTWYGGDSDGVAYAWVPISPTKTMDIPFSDANQQIAAMGPLTIAHGATKSYSRRLVVAAPDFGALETEIARLQGKSTGSLSGEVRDTVGNAIAGALVTIRAKGVDTDGDGKDDVVTRARTGATGTFAAEIPGGDYTAITSAPMQADTAPLTFSLHAGKTGQLLIEVPANGTVVFSATDSADGSSIPAKLTLVDGAGNIATRALANAGATGSVVALPGAYTAWISRGPEWSRAQVPVTVTAGGTATIPPAALTRVVDTTGFVAGDYHLHTVQSRDSPVPLDTRVLSLAAEGLEYVASTDHDRATDYAPSIAALGLAGKIASVVGDEVSLPLYGHFNAYPMPAGDAATRTDDGTKVWFDIGTKTRLDGVAIAAKLRALPGDRILQMNHPRSNQGYMRSIAYDPASGTGTETVATGFDTIEVNSEISPTAGNTILDWFSFLKQGHRMTAVGVSDSHQIWNPGYPRTLVQVGTDDPSAVTEAQFVAAMRAGHVSVSAGPFVVLTGSTGGAVTAAMGDTLGATAGGTVTLHVHVEAPDWAAYDSLELYANGALVSATPLVPPLSGGKYTTDLDLPVSPAADSFYMVIVKGPGSLYPVNGSSVFAYTNPIFVDRAPAGWTPPGL